MKKPPFLKKVKRIHFTGIKGVGMSALAFCIQDLGIRVGGSDVEEVFVTDRILKQRRISWKIGFNEKNLRPRPDLLIFTGAHQGLNNPEVLAGKKMKIPVLSRSEALGKIMEGKSGISVCGVGGKTTTCSILATILAKAGRKPSYAIGVAEIKPLGVAGCYSLGKEFVAEADEFAVSPGIDNRPQFEFQKPKIIITTNIEYDHPDIYPNFEITKQTFKKFFQKIPKGGLLVASADNRNSFEVAKTSGVNLQTYGFSPQADWQIIKSYYGQGQTIFNLQHQGVVIDDLRIKIPGRYNLLNATAGFVTGIFLGLDVKTIKAGLETFAGTKRRFEFIGETKGIKLYDDYAHHPEEIKAVIQAARRWFSDSRIIIVFQPHTYSRTKALFKDFTKAFSQADKVVITDIYASAREKDYLGVSGKLLAEETRRYNQEATYKKGEFEVMEYLKEESRPGDIIFTIGAGNIFQWHKNILKSLKN